MIYSYKVKSEMFSSVVSILADLSKGDLMCFQLHVSLSNSTLDRFFSASRSLIHHLFCDHLNDNHYVMKQNMKSFSIIQKSSIISHKGNALNLIFNV